MRGAGDPEGCCAQVGSPVPCWKAGDMRSGSWRPPWERLSREGACRPPARGRLPGDPRRRWGTRRRARTRSAQLQGSVQASGRRSAWTAAPRAHARRAWSRGAHGSRASGMRLAPAQRMDRGTSSAHAPGLEQGSAWPPRLGDAPRAGSEPGRGPRGSPRSGAGVARASPGAGRLCLRGGSRLVAVAAG